MLLRMRLVNLLALPLLAVSLPGGAAGQFTPPALPPAGQAGLPPAPAAVPASSPAPPAVRQLVADVVITGRFTAKEYDIQKHIHTRRDREFDAELVQADVRRLITSGLVRDVKTYTRQAAEGLVVIFEVEERPRIGELKFWGNRGHSDKKLEKEIGLKKGDPLNAYSAEEARRKIEELYHKSGHPKATVQIIEGDKQGDQNLIFLINEGSLERISDVEFVGNKFTSGPVLKTKIQSKPGWFWYFFGGKVDRAKIDADVQTLAVYYRSMGFFRARISRELDFDSSGKWLTLRFIIDEGPRYTVRSVTVEGNKKFASEPLLAFLKLKSGDFFNQGAMNKDLSTLVDLYGSQGHVFADVQADPRFLEEPGQLDLVYRIKEGEVFSVGEVNVHIGGEFPHTKQTVVLNRMSLRPGDIIDTREVRNSERRLKYSQLFEVNPAEGDPPRIVVRPPDLTNIRGLASGDADSTTIRGQSPDDQVVGTLRVPSAAEYHGPLPFTMNGTRSVPTTLPPAQPQNGPYGGPPPPPAYAYPPATPLHAYPAR